VRRVRCPEAEAVARAQRRRQEARQRLIGMQAVHRRRLWLESTNSCEGFFGECPETFGLEMVYPGTRYDWDSRGINPNGPIRLCPICAHGMQSYWAEMFADYYSGSGVMTCSPKDIYKEYDDDPRVTLHNLKILAGWNPLSKGVGVIATPSVGISGLSSYTC